MKLVKTYKKDRVIYEYFDEPEHTIKYDYKGKSWYFEETGEDIDITEISNYLSEEEIEEYMDSFDEEEIEEYMDSFDEEEIEEYMDSFDNDNDNEEPV